MLELEDALSRILGTIPEPRTERVPVHEAHGRFLARDVTSKIALPGFDNSSMDGYAVVAADVQTATAQQPVILRLAGKVAAGECFNGELRNGECIRIFTGSPMPKGADAVVMQEDTQPDPANTGQVAIVDGVRPWENVRFKGEDVKPGALIAAKGAMATANRIALLAATGVSDVEVNVQPRIGLLATGSELKEPGAALQPGQIYESNRAMLAPLIRRAGAIPAIHPVVPDDPQATRSSLLRAFSECDIVITSGGVSVGEMDFVKAAFEQLGGKLEFWKVSIKPGRPFVFGRLNARQFLFGLPGNPVSAFVTYLLLTRPALLQWQGASDVGLPVTRGELVEPLVNSGGRRHFIRVKIDSAGTIRPAGVQASHMLSSLADANGLVDVPPKTTFPAGTIVMASSW